MIPAFANFDVGILNTEKLDLTMIPELIYLSYRSPFPVLPPGIHKTNLNEVKERFAFTPYRMQLFNGFYLGFRNLVAAGCNAIYLNGSFTTAKTHPRDFDACWEVMGVNPRKIDSTLLDFDNQRAAQKQKFGGEFFLIDSNSSNGRTNLDFFQRDRDTGKKKGILLLDCKIPMR